MTTDKGLDDREASHISSMATEIKLITVLAYDSPITNNGYGMALEASLRQYARLSEKVHLICLSKRPVQLGNLSGMEHIASTWIPVRRASVPLRFLEGLVRGIPSIGIEYRRPAIIAAVLHELQKVEETGSSVLVFEDIPIAMINMQLAASMHRPAAKTLLRSHNVLSKAFLGLRDSASPLMRALWNIEIVKMRNWERRTLLGMDGVWAISSADVDAYRRLLSFDCHGVMGVEIDTERYRDLPPGDAETVVYIGSTDLRKKAGLQVFIENVWPQVKVQMPKARLILAGTGTEVFSDSILGVEGLGRVDDDRRILGKGQISVNPQESGTGIKLKSIIAMAAGRALVSTDIGLEGIEGTHGKHYICVPSVNSMLSSLVTLMRDIHSAVAIGGEARRLISQRYSVGSQDMRAEVLFQQLLHPASSLAK